MAALLYVIGGVSVCIIRYPTSNRRLRDRFSLSRSGCRVEYLGIGSKHLLTWATGREMRGGAAHNRDGEKQTNKSGRWGGTKGKKKMPFNCRTMDPLRATPSHAFTGLLTA